VNQSERNQEKWHAEANKDQQQAKRRGSPFKHSYRDVNQPRQCGDAAEQNGKSVDTFIHFLGARPLHTWANHCRSIPKRTGIVDEILAGSFVIRHSIRIPARS
jgi:hypothetical protein